MLCGQPGALKSFIALDIARRLADGIPLPGLKAEVPQVPVVYVAGEGIFGMPARIKAMELQESELRFLPGTLDICNDEIYGELRDIVSHDLQGGVLVLDTLSRVSIVEDENSAAEMNRVMGRLVDLAEYETGCTIFVLHHMTKAGQSYRGSTAISASVEVMLNAEREADLLGTGLIRTNVQSTKARDFPDIEFSTLFEVHMNSLRAKTYLKAGMTWEQ